MSSFTMYEAERVSEEAGGPWMIVGLGNPGERYLRTRHNVGFMVVDELASRFGTQVKRLECRSHLGRASIAGLKADLVKPQTFMNLSGDAVDCLLEKESRCLDRTIVIVDDLALPFGSLRIRAKGSAGGHNGLKSIIGRTGTEEFKRLRIGIMPDHPVGDTRKFVLDDFPASARDELRAVVERSADAVEAVLRDGLALAMSDFNN